MNQKVQYTTEVYEPWRGWFTIAHRTPPYEHVWAYDYARMLPLRWGVARVIAEWWVAPQPDKDKELP